MELVTGRAGSPHITSQQDRQKHQGVWGTGAYILKTGNNLEPVVQSSNSIQIKDGALMTQGALISVKVGTVDEVTIANGSQGMQRKDVIVARYTYNQGENTEKAEWAVVQGTPAASNPQIPQITEGDIQAGDATVDTSVFIVTLDGINITSVDVVPELAPDIAELKALIDELNGKMPKMDELYTGSANYNDYDIPDISEYDFLVVYAGPGTFANTSIIIPVSNIRYVRGGQFALGIFQSSSVFWELEFCFPDATTFNIANYKNQTWTAPSIQKMYGIKL